MYDGSGRSEEADHKGDDFEWCVMMCAGKIVALGSMRADGCEGTALQ